MFHFHIRERLFNVRAFVIGFLMLEFEHFGRVVIFTNEVGVFFDATSRDDGVATVD